MKIRKAAFLAGAGAFLAIPAFASADMHWEFANVVTGDDPGFSGTYATLDCMQMGSDAMFTLTFSDNAPAGEFLSQLDLNYDGDVSGLGFDTSDDDKVQSADFGSFVDAGSSYDIKVNFEVTGKDGGSHRIGPGDSVSFTFTGADCEKFNILSSPQGDTDGHLALLHIQGLPNGGSAKVEPVPEPASMAALGMGALGLLARRRRK